VRSKKRGVLEILQEFSIPLLGGVVVALVLGNLWPQEYQYWCGAAHDLEHWLPFGSLTLFGHEVTLNFLVNDIFMVFFFGIATKEITEACLPGGDLHPLKKAVNPLLATAGGVVGPITCFFIGLTVCYHAGLFPASAEWSTLHHGWGIPTATDIALAWLVARTVFGKGHPAVKFLLLLAVAYDGIGLVIIAIFYGDAHNPANPAFLSLILLGMGIAFAMRKAGVQSWLPYVALAGPLSWCGLMLAHLHAALALVFIIPFLPGPRRDVGLFAARDEVDQMGAETAQDLHIEHSALEQFEQKNKLFVDFGLFFFALTNAGVEFAQIGTMTWIILGSLMVGKTLGITLFGQVAMRAGFPLPDRMDSRDLLMAGYVAALGMTVALFVAGAAFSHQGLQDQAKMGALFSGFIGISAVFIGRALGFKRNPLPKTSGGLLTDRPVAPTSARRDHP